MSQSIGMILGSLADLSPHAAWRGTGPSAASGSSFADQLDASLRARARRLGLELVPTPAPERVVAESADEIWMRVQRLDAATNGIGDAIMRSLAESADARHERRHRAGGMFDI